MSEPKDCRCRCGCYHGTRNPDGICRYCAAGKCGVVQQKPEWVNRATEHRLAVQRRYVVE